MREDRWYRAAAIAAILLYLVLAAAGASSLLPWCDEGWFSDPAWNLMTRGVMASTVLDPTATWRQVQLEGLGRHTYWIMPLYVVAQVPWYKVTGFGLMQMRAFSTLWGLVALFAWFRILRKLADDRAVAYATLACLAVDFHVVYGASAGRMDMMAVALGSLGIALYLDLREQSYFRALLPANIAVAAACVTHPNSLIFFVDLCFLTLYLDARRILRVRALAIAAAPYVVALGGWGLYIMEEPGLFVRQFFGNAGGAGDRFSIFFHPLEAMRLEITQRYLQNFGMPPYSHGLSTAKLLVLFAYAAALVAFFAIPRFREARGHRILMGLAAIHFSLLMMIDGFKQAFYMVYVEPLFAAVFAVVVVQCWRSGAIPRPVVALGVAALLVVHLSVTGTRWVKNPYQQKFLAAARFLQTHAAAPDTVIASAEMGFPLGHAQRLVDDYRLGYRSGKRADFIVIDEARYGTAIPLLERQDPGNFQYIDKLLTQEYSLVYDREGYRIYRKIAGSR